MRTSHLLLVTILVGAGCGATQGTERGACYPNGTCNAGLECRSDLCVAALTDAGVMDAGAADAGTTDAGTTDAGTTDAGTTDAGTTDAGVGVCGSNFRTDHVAVDQCLTQHCCASFNPCANDVTCRACLDAPTAGCESNALLTALNTCSADHCPISFCGFNLSFQASDPVACAACVSASCCTQLSTCMGGTGEPNNADCVACLIDPSSSACNMAPSTVKTAAGEFSTCFATCNAACN